MSVVGGARAARARTRSGAPLLVCLALALLTVACNDAGKPGSVSVQLEPASPALRMRELEIEVRLEPGSIVDSCTDRRAAYFEGLPPGRVHTVGLPGRYLHPKVTVTPNRRGEQKVTVPVIPLVPIEFIYGRPDWVRRRMPNLILVVDTSRPEGQRKLEWRRGDFVLSRRALPDDVSGVAASVREAWERDGYHRKAYDRRFDYAALVVSDHATYDEVLPLVNAIAGVTRKVTFSAPEPPLGGDSAEPPPPPDRTVPAFRLRVTRAHQDRPLPRPPPPPPVPDIDAVDAQVQVVVGTPTVFPRDRLRSVRETLERIRPELMRCYRSGLERNPNLAGKVGVRFLIDVDGRVGQAANAGSDVPDSGVVSCVIEAHHQLRFEPAERSTTVTAPFEFGPRVRKPRKERR